MGANSAARRLAKKALYPVLNEHTYVYFQAVAKAWDIRKGRWSEPELDLIPRAVRAGETALDVGANYGLYSYHLSRVPRVRVYAFEPVPFTFRTLKLVARLLGFRGVKLIEKGCSDRAGRIAFTVPVQASGAMAAGQAYIGGRDDTREGKEKQVRWATTRDVSAEVVALDEFLPNIEHLSLIKCDIEGAELLCFRGAQRLIGEHLPTVICEINPWFLEGFGIKLEDLLDFFDVRGYKLYRYVDDGRARRLCEVSAAEVEEDNFIFIHPSRLERFDGLLG
jgi:FkbM family methyltransferase